MAWRDTQMGSQNSHEFYLGLYEALFEDLIRHYPELAKHLRRDLCTIKRRLASEGLSFLTRTLPAFCKTVDFSLSHNTPLSQRFFRTRDGVPIFLRGFLERVLDAHGPKCDACPASVLEVRQVCYLLYKLEMNYDETVVSKKVDDFIDIDSHLPTDFSGFNAGDKQVLACARACLQALFKHTPNLDELIPHHGPGAVSLGEKSWEKFHFDVFYKDLAETFPYDEWFYFSPGHLVDELQEFLNMPERTGVSRAAFVPKDSRGPRMIAMEPKEFMWVQQAIKQFLYAHVETHPLTKGYVNFTNQDVNRNLALEASVSGDYVTLDMSDASDRVSLALVQEIFPEPLKTWLLGCRTRSVELPGGKEHLYRKFAPMGSALCFPVEALTFWALIAGVLHVHQGVPLSIGMRTYVYGDDIIAKSEFAQTILAHLPTFGLKFNEGKCCTSGYFRESCGCDAFRGIDVTPIKAKRILLNSRDARAALSSVELSNSFYRRGYYQTCQFFKRKVEDLLGPLPCCDMDVIPMHFQSRTGYENLCRKRYNKALQRHELRHSRVCSVVEYHEVDGWSGLFSSLIQGMKEEGPNIHTVRGQLRLRRGWSRVSTVMTE